MMKKRAEWNWKKYMVRGLLWCMLVLVGMCSTAETALAAGDWQLKIEKANQPEDRTAGETFAPKGIVSSNYKIQNIFLVVYDANGKEMVSCLRSNLNVNQYDISKMLLDFTSLPVGKNYTYIVAVRDANGKKNLVKTTFQVNESSKLKIENAVTPVNMTTGGVFQPAGKISSNYDIQNVFAAISDKSGNEMVSAMAHPNQKSFDMSKMKLDTTKLAAGTYMYTAAARDSVGRKTLVKTEFVVNQAVVNQQTDAYTQKVNAFTSTDKWKNGATWEAGKMPTISNHISYGCCSYASDFVKYVFGHDAFTNGVKFTNPDEIRAGDVIHVTGSSHWVVVLRRNGEQLTTAEGNWGGKVVISDSLYTVNGGTLKRKGTKFRTFETGYHFQ